MITFEYNCPHCSEEMKGSFGENVYCPKCDITFETDCELIDAEEISYSGRLTGVEHKGKVDIEEDEN